MSQSVVTIAAVYSSVLILNFILNFFFWKKTKSRFYRLLTFTWLGSFFCYSFMGYAATKGLYLKTIALALSFLGILGFILIIGEIEKRKIPILKYCTLFLIGFVLTTIFWTYNFHFSLMCAPVILASALPALIEPVKSLLNRHTDASSFARLYYVAIFLVGLHVTDYIAIGDVEEVLIPAMSIALFLIIGITTLSMATVLEIVSTEAAVYRTRTELEMKIARSAKLVSLGEMASGVAHEVNTPLSAISISCSAVHSEVAKDEIDKNRILKHIGIISKTSKQIATITKALRVFSSKDSGGKKIVKVSELLDAILPLCEDRFKNNGINFDVDFVDRSIKCNPQQVIQAVVNLINNSFDAVKNVEKPSVQFRISERSKKIIISISDNGGGVPEDLVDRLFDPFFTTKPLGEGTGLGLSLSKSLTEANDGTIHYSRMEEQGKTTFELHFNAA